MPDRDARFLYFATLRQVHLSEKLQGLEACFTQNLGPKNRSQVL